MRRPTTKHPCSAPPCEKLISARFLFCGPHWRRVPVALQVAINASFSEYAKAQKKYLDAPGGAPRAQLSGPMLERLREYRDARDAAIELLGKAAAA